MPNGIVFERKREAVAREVERLKSTWVNPRILAEAEAERVLGKVIEREYSLADLLRRPNVNYDSLMSLQAGEVQVASDTAIDAAVQEQVEIQIKYAGYIDRQAREVERHDHYENFKLPEGLDYMEVKALSIEVRQKLNKHRPETLGQASRISGVTPAAISLLLVHLKKGGFKGFSASAGDAPAAA